jgi:hypothetical protein
MKDFGGAGLGFDFLDNIFGDFINKEKGFSFKVFRQGFGGSGGARSGYPGGINLEDLFSRTQKSSIRKVLLLQTPAESASSRHCSQYPSRHSSALVTLKSCSL